MASLPTGTVVPDPIFSNSNFTNRFLQIKLLVYKLQSLHITLHSPNSCLYYGRERMLSKFGQYGGSTDKIISSFAQQSLPNNEFQFLC